MWFAFGMAALLLVLGLLVHAFKLHFLISGYNTMSRAKREKVDVRRVARAIGVWSYANAAVFTVVGLLLALEIAVPIEVPLVFFGITTLVLLVRAQRYDGNIFDEDGNLRPGAGRQLALAGGVIAALVIGIIALLFLSSRPVEITATEEGVEISGLYGTTLEWESITEARLLRGAAHDRDAHERLRGRVAAPWPLPHRRVRPGATVRGRRDPAVPTPGRLRGRRDPQPRFRRRHRGVVRPGRGGDGGTMTIRVGTSGWSHDHQSAGA